MPGSVHCARCGAMLVLSQEAIDVHPPRATALGKRLQLAWRLRASARRVEQLLTVVRNWNWGRTTTNVEFVELGTVLRCVVPGWANFHVGQSFDGALFLTVYLITGILGLLMLGTIIGAALLGIAFATHIASAVKALISRFQSFRDRLVFTGIAAAAISVIIYWPTSAVFGRIAVPLTINRSVAPFVAGDVIWYHPTPSIEPGRLALYNSPEFYTRARAAGRQAQFLAEGGLRISRIIATAGQTLTWNQGKMLIDGREIDPPWLPASYASFLQDVTVPVGQVLIDPTDVMPAGTFAGPVTGEIHGQAVDLQVNIDPGIWRNAALVSADSLVGVVVCRTWPWSRVGFVH